MFALVVSVGVLLSITHKRCITTHQVLDLVYTPHEGQEYYDFINQQGGATFMYPIVSL